MAHLNILSADLEKIKAVFDEIQESHEWKLDRARLDFEKLLKISEMRIAFIEKLVLLDTGTFALSLSFLGSLGSHIAGRHVSALLLWSLYIAWFALFASILAGGIHNKLRVDANESLLFLISSRDSAFRIKKDALRARSMDGLMKGTLVGIAEEEVDLGEFFGNLSKALAAERNENASAFEKQAEEQRTSFKAISTRAIKYGNWTVLLTAGALFMLLTVGWQSSWILLQK